VHFNFFEHDVKVKEYMQPDANGNVSASVLDKLDNSMFIDQEEFVTVIEIAEMRSQLREKERKLAIAEHERQMKIKEARAERHREELEEQQLEHRGPKLCWQEGT